MTTATLPLPARALMAADASRLRAEYEKRYEAQFGLRIADVPVEFLTWSVHVSTAAAKPAPVRRAAARRASPAKTTRAVFDPMRGRVEKIPSYRRAELAPGARLQGPALVLEPQTTTLVPRGWRCSLTGAGHLLLESTK